MVYECGQLLGEGERFPETAQRTVVDVDLERIRQERMRQGTFDDNRRTWEDRVGAGGFRAVEFELDPPCPLDPDQLLVYTLVQGDERVFVCQGVE